MAETILGTYTRLLSEWPGLMAKPDVELIRDSLVLINFLGDARRVVDVGSGGGLPGVPLKIARPSLEMTLIDANRSKAAFLMHAVAVLGLVGVEVVAERAEDAGRDPRLREVFDVAVARAVAHMTVLAELCLPFVRVGGRLLAMKTSAEPEVAEAQFALEQLGGRLVEIAVAPSPARAHGQVVVVEKIAPSPSLYPRRAGVPARRPLGM